MKRLVRVARGMPASDGAGVELDRVIGQPGLLDLDPFLLFDHFHSDRPDDYIAGFPPHPHRGFETVTYLLAGRMRHRDNAGHEGVIDAGGVQWMTAGRGIVHSEMPEQRAGLLSGFQLWINLPASHKLAAPAYQERGADEIPEQRDASGARVRVIAGTTLSGTRGPVSQPLTDPLYLDIQVPSGGRYDERVPAGHNGFVFVVAGRCHLDGAERPLQAGEIGVLSTGGEGVGLRAGDGDLRVLLIAGRPIGEPVVRRGPFVMNTREELEQAFADYHAGRF